MLVADEPTGNLDPETAWEIMHILEEINKRGTTVIVATHAKEIVDTMQNIYSDFAYRLGTEEIPMHKKMKIRLRINEEYIDDYSNAKREYGTYTICIFSYDKNNKLIFLDYEKEA